MGFSSCERYGKEPPSAIRKLIRENKGNCLIEVAQYNSPGRLFYLFVSDSIDCQGKLNDVYSSNGSFMCHSKEGLPEDDTECPGCWRSAKKTKVIWFKKK